MLESMGMMSAPGQTEWKSCTFSARRSANMAVPVCYLRFFSFAPRKHSTLYYCGKQSYSVNNQY